MPSHSWPVVSIVIPVYNDRAGIRTTIDSLLEHTDYPADLEIIVVDNGSTDATPRVVDRYARTHDHVVLEIESDVQGSYAARNAGIRRAIGDVIVFLDADQAVTSGWLTDAIDRLERDDIAYLAPDVTLDIGDDPSIVGRYNYTTGFPIEDFVEQHRYAPTSCLLVRRSLLEDVGGFDERLQSGGDLEFGNRVDEASYDLCYEPDVSVVHPVRGSFRSLFKRNLRIGRGHCQLQRRYPDRYGRVGVPPRPSSIRSDQYDGSLHPLLFTALTLVMTGARGLGYYRECLSVVRERYLPF